MSVIDFFVNRDEPIYWHFTANDVSARLVILHSIRHEQNTFVSSDAWLQHSDGSRCHI